MRAGGYVLCSADTVTVAVFVQDWAASSTEGIASASPSVCLQQSVFSGIAASHTPADVSKAGSGSQVLVQSWPDNFALPLPPSPLH